MKVDFEEKLKETIELLKKDETLAKRTSRAVLIKAQSYSKPSSNRGVVWLVAAALIALAVLFTTNSVFSPNEEITITEENQENMIETSYPEFEEDIWKETDTLILTTFGSK